MNAPAPDPSTQITPEPLLNAEAIRAILLALGAGSWGVGLPIVIPIATTVATLVGSFALTMYARGRVWAMRRGVDVDQVVDSIQRGAR